MKRRVVQTSLRAWHDVAGVYAYLFGESPQAAERFLEQYRSTLGRLSEYPHLGSKWNSTAKGKGAWRMLPMSGFRSVAIVYRVGPASVVVMRVVHLARDWKR